MSPCLKVPYDCGRKLSPASSLRVARNKGFSWQLGEKSWKLLYLRVHIGKVCFVSWPIIIISLLLVESSGTYDLNWCLLQIINLEKIFPLFGRFWIRKKAYCVIRAWINTSNCSSSLEFTMPLCNELWCWIYEDFHDELLETRYVHHKKLEKKINFMRSP